MSRPRYRLTQSALDYKLKHDENSNTNVERCRELRNPCLVFDDCVPQTRKVIPIKTIVHQKLQDSFISIWIFENS